MRTLQGWLLPVFMLPMAVYAQEATVKEVHDAPAVRGSIIANMLQEHDNPFTLYPYDTNMTKISTLMPLTSGFFGLFRLRRRNKKLSFPVPSSPPVYPKNRFL